MARCVPINHPPRDGRMAFIRTPDGISIELLHAGGALPPAEPWASMPNTGSWQSWKPLAVRSGRQIMVPDGIPDPARAQLGGRSRLTMCHRVRRRQSFAHGPSLSSGLGPGRCSTDFVSVISAMVTPVARRCWAGRAIDDQGIAAGSRRRPEQRDVGFARDVPGSGRTHGAADATASKLDRHMTGVRTVLRDREQISVRPSGRSLRRACGSDDPVFPWFWPSVMHLSTIVGEAQITRRETNVYILADRS